METDKIIGIWCRTEDQISTFYEFKKDKTGRFFAPKIFDVPLCYNVTDNKLTVAIDKQPPITTDFLIQNEKLIITKDKEQFVYTKTHI